MDTFNVVRASTVLLGASVDFFPPNFGLKIDADTSLQDIIDWIDQAWFDSGIQSS